MEFDVASLSPQRVPSDRQLRCGGIDVAVSDGWLAIVGPEFAFRRPTRRKRFRAAPV